MSTVCTTSLDSSLKSLVASYPAQLKLPLLRASFILRAFYIHFAFYAEKDNYMIGPDLGLRHSRANGNAAWLAPLGKRPPLTKKLELS